MVKATTNGGTASGAGRNPKSAKATRKPFSGSLSGRGFLATDK
eukprot:CAMPEP_0174897752 /NCGR_PEP_ID=MMETSP0167-20121228/16563_1 /TAXON_ID=38298 /ORGANISM="Rhodella maculata, Strain CCMP736" /LENGTH=42 /DNA_ID= /DNA_START= /DNA_END= /DNA_ORIENTATION=